MATKKTKTIQLIATALLALLFTASAVAKFLAGPETLQKMASMGLDSMEYRMLGVLEIIAVVLFLVPRTGIIGALLLVAYMGGAIATHVEFDEPLVAPVSVSILVWIVSFIRFPELSQRILSSEGAK